MSKPSGGFFGANAFMDSFMNARQHGDVSALREAQLKAWQDQQKLDQMISRGSPHLGASIGGAGGAGGGAPGGGGQPPPPMMPPIQPRQPSPPSAAAWGVPSSNPDSYGSPPPSGGYQPAPEQGSSVGLGLGVSPSDHQFAQGPNAPAPAQGIGPMPQSPMRGTAGPEMGQTQAPPMPPMQGMTGPEMGNRQPPQPQPPMQASTPEHQMLMMFMKWLQTQQQQQGQNGATPNMYSGAPGMQ